MNGLITELQADFRMPDLTAKVGRPSYQAANHQAARVISAKGRDNSCRHSA